eukprot:scaffold624770_cov52-Prasinocladus_malaysianus.AAC.1
MQGCPAPVLRDTSKEQPQIVKLTDRHNAVLWTATSRLRPESAAKSVNLMWSKQSPEEMPGADAQSAMLCMPCSPLRGVVCQLCGFTRLRPADILLVDLLVCQINEEAAPTCNDVIAAAVFMHSSADIES